MAHFIRLCVLVAGFAALTPSLAVADPFDRCLTALRLSRRARGITPVTWLQLRGARPDSAVLARRRIALLLERALPDTGAVGRAPLPVRGWALVDLY